jgi:hypothetical protein
MPAMPSDLARFYPTNRSRLWLTSTQSESPCETGHRARSVRTVSCWPSGTLSSSWPRSIRWCGGRQRLTRDPLARIRSATRAGPCGSRRTMNRNRHWLRSGTLPGPAARCRPPRHRSENDRCKGTSSDQDKNPDQAAGQDHPAAKGGVRPGATEPAGGEYTAVGRRDPRRARPSPQARRGLPAAAPRDRLIS